MKKIIAIICIFILLMMAGCKAQQPQPRVEYIERVNTVEKTIIEKDTVTITLPTEQSSNVTTDTTSTVATSLAVSTATITDGKLIHDIWNKPQLNIPVEVPHTYTSNDSIVYRERTVEVEVEREFTFGEKIKLKAFWWLVLACIALSGWLCRNPLAKLLSTIIK